MREFDEIDRMTQEAVRLHAVGDYETALQLRQEAADAATPFDDRYLGIMTTIAAAQDRLGKTDEAVATARETFNTFERLRENAPEHMQPRIMRERPIAAMYLGTLTIKQAIQNEPYLSPREVKNSIKVGHLYVQEANAGFVASRRESTKPFHQHEINCSRRLSIARSIDGRPGQGLKLAIGAGAVAIFSESPLLTAETSGLSVSERAKAKVKALTGAAAAGVIALSQLVPAKRIRTRGRTFATKAL